MRHPILTLMIALLPATATADDKAFSLAAPPELVESGLLKHILPRFSLKTSTRVTLTDGAADAQFGQSGILVFKGLDQLWKFDAHEDPDAQRFADWLQSDVGKRTIDGFAQDGVQLFSSDIAVVQEVVAVTFEGDVLAGEKASLSMCGRCHVVNESNRMNAIGSTPSFAVLKALPDWDTRFQSFYALKPHAAFTQIEDVTEPFDRTRPSPIVPVEMTLDDLDNILAYVAEVPPADLGKPVESR